MSYKNIFKIISIVIGSVLLFFAAIPLVTGSLHLGVVVYLAMAVFLLSAPFIIKKTEKNRGKNHWLGRTAKFTAVFGYAFIGVFFIFVGYLSFFANSNSYKEGETPTVVVLGCQIRGDEPSLTLRYRLDAGFDMLEKYPEAVCVVSGGLSENHEYSEAEVMAGYLIKRGIEPDRIIKEDKSRNTLENMEYSAELINKANLPWDVIICTDKYHLFRACLYGKKYGLNTYCKGGKSPWGLAPAYYAREVLGVVKAYIFDL